MGDVNKSRRKVLKGIIGGAALATVPFGNFKIPIFDVTLDEFFQKHYKEMTPEEKKTVIKRLEEKYDREYGRNDVEIMTTDAIPGVLFGYALNIQKCIGCRRCVYACVKENNQSRHDPNDPSRLQIQWIRVLEFDKFKYKSGGESSDFRSQFGNLQAGVDIEQSENYYNSPKVPRSGHFYMPVQCQQCERPPCVKVCPTKATWREPDGIVVIDYSWCIGCRFCLAACPYWARRFNWGIPYLPGKDLNPVMHYLGNRPRMRGVAEKCTFCIQRTRKGKYPACVEICPVGARKFGNLLDPESEVRKVLAEKRVFRLKEELGTDPKFFYFME